MLKVFSKNGEASANRLSIGIRDIKNFDKAKQLASFIGITPLIRQSRNSLNISKMSKLGNAEFRKALYMPVLGAHAF